MSPPRVYGESLPLLAEESTLPASAPKGTPKLLNRWTAMAVSSLAAAAVLVGLASRGSTTAGHQHVASAAATSKASTYSIRAWRQGYSSLSEHTLQAYGVWEMVVEPHCNMSLAISPASQSETYTWSITKNNESFFSGDGNEVSVVFKDVNTFFNIEVADSSGTVLKRVKAMTKYVRRELHTLTDSDREEYFDALYTVFTMSESEGLQKYGSAFVSHDKLVALHDSKLYTYHNQLAFQTSHPALQLKLENALRAVNPSVQAPYWDFMRDADLGTNWPAASVYQDSWFGQVNATDFRPTGRFRDVNHVLDFSETRFPQSIHNPYGILHTGYNVNNMTSLMRSNRVCGYPGGISFSSGEEVVGCFTNYSDLYTYDLCMEHKVHANLHNMHAGMNHCGDTWIEYAMENEDWLPDGLMSFLSYEILTAVTAMDSDWLDCPESCDIDADTFETCHCHATAASGISSADDVDGMAESDIYILLGDWFEHLEQNVFRTDKYVRKDAATGIYSFRGVTEEQNLSVMKMMVKTMAFPGAWGPMGSGAASNDPIFFVMHQVFEKATSALRLSPLYNVLNFTWDNEVDDLDMGESWGAQTPWNAGIFQNAVDSSKLLTNKEIWANLDPTGDAIPHIFDQFTDWGTVNFDPWATGPESAQII